MGCACRRKKSISRRLPNCGASERRPAFDSGVMSPPGPESHSTSRWKSLNSIGIVASSSNASRWCCRMYSPTAKPSTSLFAPPSHEHWAM
eukprot:2495837-Prymnesium_polylepis.1